MTSQLIPVEGAGAAGAGIHRRLLQLSRQETEEQGFAGAMERLLGQRMELLGLGAGMWLTGLGPAGWGAVMQTHGMS